MAERAPGRSLRLIRGGRHRGARCAGLRIVAGAEDQPPFPVDAVVLEEDTYFVLSADPVVDPVPDQNPGGIAYVPTSDWDPRSGLA